MAKNQNHINIMLVEDDDTHALLIERSFQSAKKSTTSIIKCRTLTEARLVLQNQLTDIVITDLKLPDGEGIDLIPDSKELTRFPLIVMTSQGNEQAAVDALKRGALDYVVKSDVTFNDMPHIVERALREWQYHLDKRRNEELIRNSEANLAATLYSIGEGVVVTDPTGLIVKLNPMAEKIMDCSLSEVIGKPLNTITKLCDADTHTSIDDPIKTIVSQNKLVRFPYNIQMITIKNNERYIAISGSPIHETGTTISGIVLVFRDTTEQFIIEMQLRHAQKMKAIGQLAGGIAHDFNNLLTGIVNFSELLRTHTRTIPQCTKYIDGIAQATSRAAELTSNLLTFAHKGSLQAVSVDIHTVINDVIGMLRHTIDKRITIKQSLHASTVHIMGNRSQIQNAILNIALNARDAMPDGGELCFSTKNVDLTRDFCQRVSFDIQPGHYIEIGICDTGIGMDENTITHIFEPFFTTKDVSKGTGLGLATVYGTVKNHNGAITARSTYGKGSTFTIYIPVASGILPYVIASEHTAPIVGKGHVLLIDDEESIRNIGEEMLKQIGYTTTICSDGNAAVQEYRRNHDKIDIVLLDMVMPHPDGKFVIKEIRELNPNAKIVVTTGFSVLANAEELNNLGIRHIIQKPYTIIELSHTLAACLASS